MLGIFSSSWYLEGVSLKKDDEGSMPWAHFECVLMIGTLAGYRSRTVCPEDRTRVKRLMQMQDVPKYLDGTPTPQLASEGFRIVAKRAYSKR
jgi:hypothetical protein